MDLRRPTRLAAALVAAAALLLATPAVAVPVSGDWICRGAFSWLERGWAQIEVTISDWAGASGNTGPVRSITAANGEGVDPNGASGSSTPTTSSTSGSDDPSKNGK